MGTIPESVRVILIRALDAYGGDDGKAAKVWLDQQPAERLTMREMDVLRLVAQGYSNREIGETLTITERTTRTHVSNILSKTGLDSRTRLALWAIRRRFVTLDAEE